jgi:hypothetical protein
MIKEQANPRPKLGPKGNRPSSSQLCLAVASDMQLSMLRFAGTHSGPRRNWVANMEALGPRTRRNLRLQPAVNSPTGGISSFKYDSRSVAGC